MSECDKSSNERLSEKELVDLVNFTVLTDTRAIGLAPVMDKIQTALHELLELRRAQRRSHETTQQRLTASDYEEVLADHRRLVRELDVALNGSGAAKQASLCDIVAQVRDERWRLVRGEKASEALCNCGEFCAYGLYGQPGNGGRCRRAENGLATRPGENGKESP